MTDTERQALHLAILQIARAAGDIGMPDARLRNDVKLAGFETLGSAEIDAALVALEANRWIAFETPALAPRRICITARGERVLNEAKL